jgi:trimeric autotransporter adhesin
MKNRNITFTTIILFALTCLTLSPATHAECRDGCDNFANTFQGEDALVNNTLFFSFNNTAIGFNALYNNTDGDDNTATGYAALNSNTIGTDNTSTEVNSLFSNTTGNSNTAHGSAALATNTTGSSNTATGAFALQNNTTGSSNIAVGHLAGANLTTGSNNIDIGNLGVAGEKGKIRIGTQPTHKNTYIAGIYGVTISRGVGVIVDSTGHLGTVASSKHFKDNIQPMDKASEAILALKPVTFRYKKELDPEGIQQFGLVAEEVEKVNSALVARDDQRKPYTVRYEAVNAMLLNEFLKEHRTVQALKATIAKQEATIAQQQKDFRATAAQQQKEIQALTTSLKEQAAQIQKVSAQIEASRRAQQTVVSSP